MAAKDVAEAHGGGRDAREEVGDARQLSCAPRGKGPKEKEERRGRQEGDGCGPSIYAVRRRGHAHPIACPCDKPAASLTHSAGGRQAPWGGLSRDPRSSIPKSYAPAAALGRSRDRTDASQAQHRTRPPGLSGPAIGVDVTRRRTGSRRVCHITRLSRALPWLRPRLRPADGNCFSLGFGFPQPLAGHC